MLIPIIIAAVAVVIIVVVARSWAAYDAFIEEHRGDDDAF